MPQELEKFRLILSTYQDGTGQYVDKSSETATIPGLERF